MYIENNLKQRLPFLSRVLQRESYHLNRTTERLFAGAFTLERAQQINSDDDLSERVEAFTPPLCSTSRYTSAASAGRR